MKTTDIKIDIFSKHPLYLQIYEYFKSIIENKKISENEKLPSIRQLAIKLKLSKLTVLKAYNILETEGYIYMKHGSGAFVKKKEYIYNNKSNNTLTENFKYGQNNSKYGQNNFEKTINFSSGTPNEELYPFEEYKKYMLKIFSEKNADSLMTYQNTQGYEKLREIILKKLKSKKIEVSLNNIQITSGSQQALDLILKTVISKRNNKVIVGNPTYHGALNSFKSHCKIFTVDTENDGFNMEQLEEILSKENITFIYTMMDYSCPTGITWSIKKRKQLLYLAEKYKTFIVEDDCLSELSYNGIPNLSLKEIDNKNLYVISIKSFSKILMPGLRLAYMVIPKKFSERVADSKFISDISCCGLNQKILTYFLEDKTLDIHLKNVQKIYTERYKILYNELSSIKDLKIQYEILGGFYIWVKLSDNFNSKIFYKKCREKNILVLPGSIFSHEIKNSQNFRLSFASINSTEIIEGISRIKKILDEMRD